MELRGGPRQVFHLRELARIHTEESLNTLVKLMRKSRNEMVRLRASETLLARGYGLPTAYVETTSSLAEEIDKIKRRSAAGPAAVVPLFPALSSDDEEL